MSSPFLPLYIRVLLFGVAYFGLSVLGQQFSLKSGAFVNLWLPNGLFVGLLLTTRRRHWPMLVTTAVIANICFDYVDGKVMPESLLFSLANGLDAVVGALLVLRYAGNRLTLSTLRDVIVLVLCAAIVGPLVGATIGTTTIIALLDGSSPGQTFAMWWSGDALGVLLLAPFVIVWQQRDQTQPPWKSPVVDAKAIFILFVAAFVTYIAFNHQLIKFFPLKYLLVPVVVLVALHYGTAMSICVNLIIALIASGMASHGFHDISVLELSELNQIISLQLFLGVLIFFSLFTSAIINERKKNLEALEESRRFLDLTEKIGNVGGWEFNVDNGRQKWTKEVYAIHEVSTDFDPNVEKGIGFYVPASQPIITEAFQHAIEQERPFDLDLEIITAKGNLRDVHVIGLVDLNHRKVYGLIQDITKQKQMEAERNQLVASLAEKNKEMEDIFRVTSHDLRSPLISIEGFTSIITSSFGEVLSILEEEKISAEKKGKLASVIQNSLEAKEYIINGISKMGVLLDGLMQVSSLGRVEIEREDLEMNLIMADTLANFEYQSNMKGVKIEVSKLPSCFGNSAQIDQLFSNLIGNALKYTSPERPGVIRISGHIDGDQSVYCVEDNGIGISPEYKDEIFKIFRQLDRKAEGEGLGLCIVKKIVERLKGRIWVESEVGKGSHFYVSIPHCA